MVGGPIAEMEYGRLAVGPTDYLIATAGTGSPVLLLHGFPQTHYCWRDVVPRLADRFAVVAPDLRGYGGTSAPPGGPRGDGFSKREMAAEGVELMARLGHTHFAVVGHDRGARVAYRMALDHPDRIEALTVVNVVPTVDQFQRMGSSPSLGYWPWFLLAQPAPFPEQLIEASREAFLRFIFDSWTAAPGIIQEDAVEQYLSALDGETIAAMCSDYRASYWLDREDDETDRKAGRRIACRMLLVTGEQEAQLTDAAAVWSRWADDLRHVVLPGGHFIPEEAPQELAMEIRQFLERPA
jgi:haloacetate dehalogenase